MGEVIREFNAKQVSYVRFMSIVVLKREFTEARMTLLKEQELKPRLRNNEKPKDYGPGIAD